MHERNEYVERELEKLREKYEVPYEKEFSLKALFSLQHQFHDTPDDHIRTKTDILNAISGLEKGFNFKKKVKSDKIIKVLIRFDNENTFTDLVLFLESTILDEQIIKKYVMNKKLYDIQLANGYHIIITNSNDTDLRGKEYDITLDLRENRRVGTLCYIFSDGNKIILHPSSYDTMTSLDKKIYDNEDDEQNIDDIAKYIASKNFAKVIYYIQSINDDRNYAFLRNALEQYNVILDGFGNIKYPK